ncbi:hypothetical protein Vi05172_g3526 [Venturia inaequalis]|nr:hypothetical protein Vi05172_g3526 [Venturia inaequalis]
MVPDAHLGKLGTKSALAHITNEPQQLPACVGFKPQSWSDEQENLWVGEEPGMLRD